MTHTDTIVAIATPIGIGALLVIRVSGEKAITAVDAIFSGRKKLAATPSHTVRYGKIYDREGHLIDDVLVSVFRTPHSYTGEDSCEITTHGNPFIAQKIIQLLLEQGARLAEHGEYTRRAFLNGRLDLAQAEAVLDVIEASTEASLRGARNQLDGFLSQKVSSLRDLLVETSSLVELELDFGEEDLEFLSGPEISRRIDAVLREIGELIDSYSFGRLVRDGVNVAIVGKPNVGKSSLLNYILKEPRAIVSPIPGTTRDVIREEAVIDGILYRLMDTAGLRPTADEIEEEGVSRSRKSIRDADIVVFVNDVETKIDGALYETVVGLCGKDRVITLLNKIDLGDDPSLRADVRISAKTGAGMGNLFKKMKEKTISTHTYTEKNAIVTTLRHYNSLKKAGECLMQAKKTLEENLTGEFVASDIRNASAALAEIIGVVTSDDVLDRIFSKF